jgi:hypothetical protein
MSKTAKLSGTIETKIKLFLLNANTASVKKTKKFSSALNSAIWALAKDIIAETCKCLKSVDCDDIEGAEELTKSQIIGIVTKALKSSSNSADVARLTETLSKLCDFYEKKDDELQINVISYKDVIVEEIEELDKRKVALEDKVKKLEKVV